MASMTDAARGRASGFKRIMLRLDDGTRRKYCCRALGEDLQEVQQCVATCVEAMAQVRQVEDATRQLEANQSRLPSTIVTALLSELEDLQATFQRAATALLGPVHETARTTDKHDKQEAPMQPDKKEPLTDILPGEEAQELLGKIIHSVKIFRTAKRHERAEKLVAAVDVLKQFVRLMPAATDASVPPGELLWWKRRAETSFGNLRAPVLDYASQLPKELSRLGRMARKAAGKIPELASLARNTETMVAEKKEELSAVASSKSKKKKLPLPDANESSASSAIPKAAVVTAAAATAKSDVGNGTTSGSKALPIEKARSLLTRCAREVKTLRDKFEVGAYNVNLDRMMAIVDSVLSQLSFEELAALSTALFTLVEVTEKVVNVTKRRDFLVCLKSVLGVLAANASVLQLSSRRKTMIEEYANNCQQSLRLLNHATTTKTGSAASGASSGSSSTTATASTAKAIKTQTARDGESTPWPKNHVRFG